MIAFVHPQSARNKRSSHHDAFVAMLSQIKHQAVIAFRDRNPGERDDLVQEVVANSFCTFARLVETNKMELAFATQLANYAIRQVVSGRRVGSRLNVRDVMSPANHRVTVEPLEQFEGYHEICNEVLVEDRRAGPAETAAVRIDVAKWFRKLSSRNRRIAKTLAFGESTRETAKKFGLSSGRVSQLRQELKQSWQAMQGERADVCANQNLQAGSATP